MPGIAQQKAKHLITRTASLPIIKAAGKRGLKTRVEVLLVEVLLVEVLLLPRYSVGSSVPNHPMATSE